jgi:hypothetical protein
MICSQKALYRDTRKTQKTCNWTAKTVPCFALSGWCRDVTRFGYTAPAFTRSATLTPFIAGPLGSIPHTDFTQLNSQANGTKNVLIMTKYFVTFVTFFVLLVKIRAFCS